MKGRLLGMRLHALLVAAGLLAWVGLVEAAGASDPREEQADATARMLFSSDGVRSGLCLHLECGTGYLTAALRRNGAHVVQGITSDRSSLEEARRHIQSQGLYGPVAVAHCDMKELPYADGIANLIVAEDYAALSARGTDADEIMRVLAPYGTAFVKGLKGTVPGAVSSKVEGWTKVRKPAQPGVDEWTHFEHDPERTSVSQDTAFGLPTGFRWISGMFWPYSMNDVAFGSTRGRNFYWYWAHHVARYGPQKEHSRMMCRDAFSGVLLWDREIERLPHGASFVAIGERLYVDMGGPGGLVALDAATGAEVLRFEGSGDQELSEIVVTDGLLVQCAKGIRAFDAKGGSKLWEKENPLTVTDMMLTGDQRIYYLHQERREAPFFLVCCDVRTGQEQWRAEQDMEHVSSKFTDAPGLLSYHQGVILAANTSRMEFAFEPGILYALSAEDGSRLWEYRYSVVDHKGIPTDVFPIGDDVWVKTRDPELISHGIYVALDLATGAEKGRVNVGYNRCYPDRASTRYLLTGSFDFVRIPGGETYEMWAARGHCNTGFMVAQGLTYAFPTRCTCFNLVRGFLALDAAEAPATDGPQEPTPLKGRLSSLTVSGGTVFVSSTDEHRVVALDADSGQEKWSFTAGARVDSPPTVHRGLVLFGSADGRVYCLRAADGQLAWSLRAAPADRGIPVRGQIESLWPVPGSVLVSGGTLYFAAGRNTHADGGLRYYAADPLTGRVKWGKTVARNVGESNNDVMIRGENSIHLGHRVHFTPENGTLTRGAGEVVFAPFGLLADCLKNGPVAREDILRRQWGYGRVSAGAQPRSAQAGKRGSPWSSNAWEDPTYGVLAVDGSTVYGAMENYEFNSEEGRSWVRTLTIQGTPIEDGQGWEVRADPSLLMRALVATADKLLLAVQPEEEESGELWILSKANGSTLAKMPVASVPRWDGLAVADGRAFVVTTDGRVTCLGPG